MGDISKTIVVVLILATLLVSIVGTWSVLNTIDNAIAKKFSVDKGYGHVSIEIATPDTSSRQSIGHGRVSLTILPRP